MIAIHPQEDNWNQVFSDYVFRSSHGTLAACKVRYKGHITINEPSFFNCELGFKTVNTLE